MVQGDWHQLNILNINTNLLESIHKPCWLIIRQALFWRTWLYLYWPNSQRQSPISSLYIQNKTWSIKGLRKLVGKVAYLWWSQIDMYFTPFGGLISGKSHEWIRCVQISFWKNFLTVTFVPQVMICLLFDKKVLRGKATCSTHMHYTF